MRKAWCMSRGLLLGVSLFCTGVSANVTVKRDPPLVEHKTFDPARPPKEMPHLNPGEAAVTESVFNCSVSTSYHAIERKPQEGRCDCVVKIDSVEVKLQLHITVWLPESAPEKLAAHEEGHRQIAEQIYRQNAESAAKVAAQKIDGKQLSGTGRDCDEATTAALNDADTRLCQDYLNQTGAPAGRVGDMYDEITAHGTKYWPAEDEAIRQAFDRWTRDTRH